MIKMPDLRTPELKGEIVPIEDGDEMWFDIEGRLIQIMSHKYAKYWSFAGLDNKALVGFLNEDTIREFYHIIADCLGMKADEIDDGNQQYCKFRFSS